MQGWFLITILTQPVLHVVSANYCYADEKNPYLSFATRTDWRVAANNHKDNFQLTGCDPLQLWVVTRPGVSWPKRPIVERLQTLHQLKDRIVANHEAGRGKLCSKDIDNFRSTRFPPNMDIPETMADQGNEDLKELGKTFKKSFPSILQKPYTTNDFKIRCSRNPAVWQSALNFAMGLFGEGFDINILPLPQDKDTLLDLPLNCDAWKMEAIGNCAKERAALDRSNKIKSLVEEVNNRLGFQNPLGIGDIILMYQGCSLEKATNPSALPIWCAAFTNSDLQLLEYRDDLFYFRSCGPGDSTPLVNRMSCPLVNDLIQTFTLAEKGERNPPAIFYFADEKSLLILLHGLGLVESTLGDVDHMEQRTFRSATLMPFAASFTAILYRCLKGEKLQVVFYLNGQKMVQHSWRGLQQDLSSFYVDSSECSIDYCRMDKFHLREYASMIAKDGPMASLLAAFMALLPI